MNFINHKHRETKSLKSKYINNVPCPHIVLDDFIDEDLLNKVLLEFPDLSQLDENINYNNSKEVKFTSIGTKDLSKRI